MLFPNKGGLRYFGDKAVCDRGFSPDFYLDTIPIYYINGVAVFDPLEFYFIIDKKRAAKKVGQ